MNREATVDHMKQGYMNHEGLTPAERKARALMRCRIFNLPIVYVDICLAHKFEE
jgi:hypothetical protein